MPAIQKLFTEQRFDFSDALGQRRLTDIDCFGCLMEIPIFSQRQ